MVENKRETVAFEAIGQNFEACVEATFEDRRESENIAARLSGGGVELAKKEAEYLKLAKKIPQTDEGEVKPSHAVEAYVLNDFQNALTDIYAYATISVMLINPPVALTTLKEEEVLKIHSAYEVALKEPFLEKESESTIP